MRKKTRYFLEAVAAHIIYGIFAVMPARAASWSGGKLLRCVGPRMGISRRAATNIARAFPEKSSAERQEILYGMWENLGRVIAEYPHLKKISEEAEVVGLEHIKPGAALFVSGHVANWEVQSTVLKQRGYPIHVVYRRPNNPYVDRLLRHARRVGAVGQIVKGEKGAREIFSVLRQGGTVGMLVDQKMNEGIPVPFLGRPAMTGTAAALFSLKMNCPLYPGRIERISGTKFRVTAYPPLLLPSQGDHQENSLALMTHINQLLEEWIRARPEQWLWLHRRWPESHSS